eukprot:g1389.t1
MSEAQFDLVLRGAAARARRPELGLLGLAPPAAHRVLRESISFVGGGLAALLQLAHPFVAHAIAEHSYTRDDVTGRFVNTFKYVFAVTFGDMAATLRAARAVRRVHCRVHGVLPEDAGRWRAGEPYSARMEHALVWVFATLVETSEFMHELFIAPRSDAERDAHWRYAKSQAALWGIRPAALPGSYAEFEQYYFAMLSSDELAVTPPAQALCGALLRPPHWERRAGTSSLRLATSVLMPEPVGRAFGLRASSPQYAVVLALLAAIKMLYSMLPGSFRYLTQYHQWRLRETGVGGQLSATNRLAAALAKRFVDAYLASIGSQMQI